MRLHVGEHSGFVEEAVLQSRGVRLLATAHQPSAIFQTLSHIALHFFQLCTADERAHRGLGVCRDPGLVALRQQLDDFLQYLVMDGLMQKDAASGAAALTRPSEVHTSQDAVHKFVEIRIGVGNQRVLSAKFQ